MDGFLIGEVDEDGLRHVHAGADEARILRRESARVVEGVRHAPGAVGVGHAGGVKVCVGIAQANEAFLGRFLNEMPGPRKLRGCGQQLDPFPAQVVQPPEQVQVRILHIGLVLAARRRRRNEGPPHMDAQHAGHARLRVVHPLTQGFIGFRQNVLREGVHRGQIPGDPVPQQGLGDDLIALPVGIGKVAPPVAVDLQIDEAGGNGHPIDIHGLLPLAGLRAIGQDLHNPVPFDPQIPIDKVVVQQQFSVLNEHVLTPTASQDGLEPKSLGRRYIIPYLYFGGVTPVCQVFFGGVPAKGIPFRFLCLTP